MKRIALSLLSLAALAACDDNGLTPEEQLTRVREQNDRYQSAAAALADGFLADPMCVDAGMVGAPAALGAMGLHYANPARLGITATAPRVTGSDPALDPEQPEILIYEPQENGTKKLVAVEYMVFEAAWKAAGHEGAPTLFGRTFAYMKDVPGTPNDEAHGFEPHYELHVWLYRDNPNGMFAEFNPAVSCAAAH